MLIHCLLSKNVDNDILLVDLLNYTKIYCVVLSSQWCPKKVIIVNMTSQWTNFGDSDSYIFKLACEIHLVLSAFISCYICACFVIRGFVIWTRIPFIYTFVHIFMIINRKTRKHVAKIWNMSWLATSMFFLQKYL